MAREYASVDDTGTEVVGSLAFSALTAMTRLAKDGDQAPDIRARVEHARISTRVFELLEQLETWAGHRGCDLHEAAGQYSGLYDDLGTRVRPSTWSERSVKTYVTLGIVGDSPHEVNERCSLFDTNLDVWDLNQGGWERDHLAPQIGEDPQPTAHLSLWTCRVAGEALGLVRVILSTYPVLTKEPDAADEIAALVTKRYSERMTQINLKA